MLTQVWEAQLCWCVLSACVCVSECFLWEPGTDWLPASSTGAHGVAGNVSGPPACTSLLAQASVRKARQQGLLCDQEPCHLRSRWGPWS